MDEQELRQKGFGLYAPGTPVPPGHMKIQQGDEGPVWVGPRSAFQESPMGTVFRPTDQGTVEPLSTGIPAYGAALGRGALNLGIKSALPTAGAVGGGMIPGVGPIAAPLGAMAGMKANEMLGIEEPQGAMQYLIGGALAGAPPLFRGGLKMLPGSELAQQELGRETAAKLPDKLLPSMPSKTLYAALPPSTSIPLPATRIAAGDLAVQTANMAPSLRTATMKRITDAAWQLTQQPGGISPEQLQANVTQFGRIVRQAQQTGAIHEAAASKIYGSLLDDLEAAGAKQGSQYAPALRQAADAYKHELASQRLADILGTEAKGVTRSRGGVMNTNWDAAVNKIMTDKDMKRWLPEAERTSLVRDLQQLAKDIPQIPAAAGPGIGGQSFAQRAIGGGLIGGAIGSAVGSPAVGGMIGVAATEAIARLLMTSPGRMMVRGMLRKGIPYEAIAQLAGQMGGAGLRP